MYLFLERGKEREETQVCQRNINWLSIAHPQPPTRDLACNPGVCPDWESNWWLFGLKDYAQPTEPQQSGPPLSLISFMLFIWLTFLASLPWARYHSKNFMYTTQAKLHNYLEVCYRLIVCLHRGKTTWGHSEVSVYKPGKRVLTRNWHGQPVDRGLPSL